MEQGKPAVISVFAAVSFVLIAGLICGLLEGARVVEMKALAPERATLLSQNIFSNFQRELYESYGLLGLDEVYSRAGEEEKVGNCLLEQEFAMEQELSRRESGVSFLNYSEVFLENEGIQLLSDHDGAVFLNQAANYMLPVLTDEEKLKLTDSLEEMVDENEKNDTQERIADAKDALATATNMQEGEEKQELSVGELEEYETKKAQPILSLLHLEKEASHKKILSQYCVTKRKALRGNMSAPQTGMAKRVLGIVYCVRNLQNYRSPKDTGDMFQYQTEYLIGGKETDDGNLEVVARRILLMREAVQFARILKDAVKVEKANALATAIVGFTANPFLIKAVELGILAAWALKEAIRDVRRLLHGEKLSLFGNEKEGLWGYEEFLQLLLFMEKPEKWSMRALDVVEHGVNFALKTGCFHVDRTVTRIEGELHFKIPWLFANVLFLPEYKKGGLQIKTDFIGKYV